MSEKLKWSVDTPALLKDIIPNATVIPTLSPSILVIFQSLLVEVAQRATELHDPKLDSLMLRLNMYEIEGKTSSEKNRKRCMLIDKLEKEAKKLEADK